MKKTGPKNYLRMRVTIVGAGFAVLLAVIAGRAVHLQVYRHRWLSEMAAGQYEKSVVAQGKRGAIYDARFHDLAVSLDVISIGLHPQKVTDRSRAAVKLARALHVSPKLVQRKLKSKKTFVWLKRKASPRQVAAVKDLSLECVAFVKEHSRFYPNRSLAAQVIGFCGMDGNGLEGLEFLYNRVLQGGEDRFTVLRDARGRWFEADRPPYIADAGSNLVLTIDAAIQHITEKALAEAVRKYSAKAGMAIVMRPTTGAIMALANYPYFNPNSYRDYGKSRWRNRAITDPFEPGSTMKIFLAAAALESGKISPGSIFFCENGAYRIGRRTVHDTHPYGWLSLQQIVKKSSNIGAVKVGALVGSRRLHDKLRQLGFGSRTGIDAPGESAGLLMSYRKWTPIDAGAIAFGQGLAVTAVQLASAVGAIANDGILMRPHLVQAITDPNGKLAKKIGPQKIRRAITPETARTLRRIMRTVTTEGGTGMNAAVEGYSVAGKTGTAQKVGPEGGYTRGKYVSSFVGFLPAEDPEAVILVVVDEPKKFHYGGTVAAPAFKTIARSVMDHLGVPPRRPAGEKFNVALVEEVRP